MEKDKNSHTKTIHLKYLGQPGMEILNYIPDGSSFASDIQNYLSI